MTGLIQLSRNEIAYLVRKAARGAGFYWGEAEDCAWAVLQMPVLPPSTLIPALTQGERPRLQNEQWLTLNPFATGLALMNMAGDIQETLSIPSVLHPAYVEPFLHQVNLCASYQDRHTPTMLTITRGANLPHPPAARYSLAVPEHKALTDLAMRTYAPASEALRLSDAG